MRAMRTQQKGSYCIRNKRVEAELLLIGDEEI